MKILADRIPFSRALLPHQGPARGAGSISLLLLCLLTSLLPAQNAPHPAFRQYTTDDGLASSEVYSILQDRDGYIWIASDNGVSRFDGYEFRNYGLQDGLRENVIFLLRLDTIGRVWMQAMSGNLYYFDGTIIRPYEHNDVLQEYNDERDVNKGFIVEGAGETIHIADLKYGVLTITEDGCLTTYPHEDPLYRQVFEKNGQLLNASYQYPDLAAVEGYISRLNSRNQSCPIYFHRDGELRSFPDLRFSTGNGSMPEAFYLREDCYLLQLFSEVYLIEHGQITWQFAFPHRILHARLWENGQLYLGLGRQQGLQIYASLDAFREGQGTTWLQGQSVSYFMEDREGGRWLATNEDGVFYTPAESVMVYDEAGGLPYQKVSALAVRNDQELYVGLGNGAIWHLDLRKQHWEALPTFPNHGLVKDLYMDRQRGQLWAGSFNLHVWQDDQWHPMPISSLGEAIFTSHRITASPRGDRLWLCDHRGFMSIELPQREAANRSLGEGRRAYIAREDFSGRVWVGQSTGLYEWKDSTLISRRDLHPALSLRVEDIALMPDSTLVVATKGGGLVFLKDGQAEQLTTDDGLTANMLECVLADPENGLWAGTLNGLNRVTGSWGDRRIEQITVFHGLPSNEINRVATAGERIWVATNKGLASLSRDRNSGYAPPPRLTNLLVNNESYAPDQSLRLPYHQNNLTIRFLALNYRMNGQIPYRYRLDEGEWTTTHSQSLNFPALPPGERLLELQAQNEDGLWSRSTTVQFLIRSPWWERWWARLGMLLLTVGLTLSLYRYRTRQQRREADIRQQIAELERSALQAQMNPHFIFNCLNSIQNFILQNEKQEAIHYLGRFAALVRSMLNASVAGQVSLHEEIQLLDHYLSLEKLRFKERFDYSISCADQLDRLSVMIPPLLVQPFVENAVLHGMAGRSENGQISIRFERKKDYLEVKISDNGTGKPGSDDTPSPPSHKSFGMSITRSRLELLFAPDAGETVDRQTIMNEHGQPNGTQVTIRIGLDKEAT